MNNGPRVLRKVSTELSSIGTVETDSVQFNLIKKRGCNQNETHPKTIFAVSFREFPVFSSYHGERVYREEARFGAMRTFLLSTGLFNEAYLYFDLFCIKI